MRLLDHKSLSKGEEEKKRWRGPGGRGREGAYASKEREVSVLGGCVMRAVAVDDIRPAAPGPGSHAYPSSGVRAGRAWWSCSPVAVEACYTVEWTCQIHTNSTPAR